MRFRSEPVGDREDAVAGAEQSRPQRSFHWAVLAGHAFVRSSEVTGSKPALLRAEQCETAKLLEAGQ